VTAVPLGVSSFKRIAARTPEVLLNNMFVEKDPTNLVDGLVRIQRPGLSGFATTVGDGPIRGFFKQLGTFGGDILAVSATELYRINDDGDVTDVGAVTFDSAARVQIAAGLTRALIATGQTCYSTDGTTITAIVMPDDQEVSSVAYINGYFILTVTDSQRFYWIVPGGTDPDALDFASAENSPDNLVRCERIGDEIWFFGEGSIEVWIPTGNADLPFERVEGRLYDKGCANRDTVAKLDNTLFWVGQDKIVYRADTTPIRVSDNSIEERIAGVDQATLRAWAFAFNGHTFYCLTIGVEGTFFFDVSVGNWGEFSSYGRHSWRAHMGGQTSGSEVFAGDDQLGTIWKLDPALSNDGGEPMVREIIGGVALLGQPIRCDNFSIYAATGWSKLTGNGANSVLQFRISDDGGNTWGNWRQISLGATGQYGGEVAAHRLGMIRTPGRIFHVKMTDDSVCRFSYARINEFTAR
jgi:hypothetical protein